MTKLSKLTDDEALRLRKFRNEYPEFAKQLDALAAEVERLKIESNRLFDECTWRRGEQEELRDLVREADGIIGDAYGSHYDARLSAADRCAWCKRAATWRKKAQA